MDIVKGTCDAGLTCWDRTAEYRRYIRSLKDNLDSLERKMGELSRVSEDVNRLVESAEEERWIRTDAVAGWLKRVEDHKKDADDILSDGKQIMGRTCLFGRCFSNCRARYKKSKLAKAKVDDIESTELQGRNFAARNDKNNVAYEPDHLILDRSLTALQKKKDELEHVYEDVKQQVKREENQHFVRTHEVGGWLERVKLLLEKEVPEILSQRNYPSKHVVEEKRAALEEELGKGRAFTIPGTIRCYKPDDPLMVEIPLEPPVGLDSVFSKVWRWIEDGKVTRIGLYGMGGVGKTTLLKKIHNEFVQIKHEYNLVAWIVVSQPANPEKIQEAIWKKLNLPGSEWDGTSEMDRASKILGIMKKKSFMLFLDDIWEEVNLLKLGIPSHKHQYKSKIIFTTRSEDVCGSMQADRKEKVLCLPREEALKLFQEKVGEETWSAHVEIPKLAEALVEECECLPLALITVGSAMASRKNPVAWRQAIKDLKNCPLNFPGMEKKVISVLEFSYEALPNETQKKCFLYISLFPEDYEIGTDELIDMWIGEGFLDDCDDGAHGWGMEIISSLTRACLLENSNNIRARKSGSRRMHDVIREMALWVASDRGSGKKKNKILVQDKLRSFEPKEVKKWNDAEKISLWNVVMDQKIPTFPATLSCSGLSTLILRNTNVQTFPCGFFPSMLSLRVLDLSTNDCLAELPEDIGKLVNLRYLNLHFTKIRKLPVNITSLKELVVLLLDRKCLVLKEQISSFSSLRVFCLDINEDNLTHEDNLIDELKGMDKIEEVRLTLNSSVTIQKVLMSIPHLQRCLGGLRVATCRGLSSLIIPKPTMSEMENLRYLDIVDCELAEVSIKDGEYGCHEGSDRSLTCVFEPSSLENRDYFRSLTKIQIFGCDRLRDVTPLIYHAPSLVRLSIFYCSSMRELIAGDVDDSHVNRIFSCLSTLYLAFLPELESICRRALPFPSLNIMQVLDCPILKKLPLDRKRASRVSSLQIYGEEWWWEELQWDDQETERLFSTKFVKFR